MRCIERPISGTDQARLHAYHGKPSAFLTDLRSLEAARPLVEICRSIGLSKGEPIKGVPVKDAR